MPDSNTSGSQKDLIVEVKQYLPEEKPKPEKKDYLRTLEILQKYLWLGFGIFVFCLFYPQIKEDIIPNISSFNIGGFSATLKDDLNSIPKINAFPEKNSQDNYYPYISPIQKELIIQRTKFLYKRLNHSKILWVDTNIEENKDLRLILKKWGVKIDCALTDDEAFVYLNNSLIDTVFYDLIITNHSKDTHKTNGTDFAKKVHDNFPADIPIILFSFSQGNEDTLRLKGVPANIFAATNRYDYLFHFIFDALERGNTPYPGNIQRYVSKKDSL